MQRVALLSCVLLACNPRSYINGRDSDGEDVPVAEATSTDEIQEEPEGTSTGTSTGGGSGLGNGDSVTLRGIVIEAAPEVFAFYELDGPRLGTSVIEGASSVAKRDYSFSYDQQGRLTSFELTADGVVRESGTYGYAE